MINTKQKFMLSPEWTIKKQDNNLILYGGADSIFSIEIEDGNESFFESLTHNQKFTSDSLDIFDKRIFEQLLTAEIIKPSIKTKTKSTVAIIGDDIDLNLTGSEQLAFTDNMSPHDYLLIVRSTSSYSGLLKKINYYNIKKVHLFFDVAFNHTISIGPLVFPGETACLACLTGRISNRWNDDTPPPMPSMTINNHDLIKGIIISELTKIIDGDTSLINKTVSWNFQNRTVESYQLLKVPLCPICNQNKFDLNGKIMLP